MYKILITGANGQLGNFLKINKSKKYKYFFYEKEKLNILNIEEIFSIFKKIKPNFIINTAAFTNVSKAENIPFQKLKCNFEGVLNLLKICKKFNTFMIHLSSDYVFDGLKKKPYLETDKCFPINKYGKSKFLGEENIIKYNYERFIILRTSWLYSSYSINFLNTIIDKINENKNFSLVRDLRSNPTSVNNLVKFINIIIKNSNKFQNKKILHLRDSGNSISPYDFAKFVLSRMQNNKKLKTNLIPVLNSEYKSNVKRPLYSSLNINNIMKITNQKPEHWKVEVSKILDIKGL